MTFHHRHAHYLASVLGSPEDPRRPLHLVWFAGGGGSSCGFRQAFGFDPDYALNHNADALRMHEVNHPGTAHLRADAFAASPLEIEPGRPIGTMWFSPDCTHHSKARGSAPVSKRIRGLAWCVIPWAKLRKPAVIFLENVEEFQDWGPLYPEDHPRAGHADPARKGETFRRFIRRLEQCGYVVEWRERVAADRGAPTTRKRFFLVARCDGQPIVWSEPRFAPREKATAKGLRPWRGAHECIDWSIPCPSIFMTQAEAKAQGLKIKRPLVPATRRRIARGIDRYVISAGSPFIVPITQRNWGRLRSAEEPIKTITASKGGEFAVSAAHLTKFHADNAGAPVDGPMPTVTANHYIKRPGGAVPIGVIETGLQSSPYLVPAYGEREGQEPRVRSAEEPYPTVVPGQNGGRLVAPTLIRTDMTGAKFSGVGGPDEPVRTITGAGGFAVTAACLGRQFGTGVGRHLADPCPTVMPDGAGKTQLISAHLSTYYATGTGSDAGEPMRTVTGEDRHGVVAAFMEQANTDMIGHAAEEPVSTIVGKGCTQRLIEARLSAIGAEPGSRRRQVLEFLWEHFGAPSAEQWADPLGSREARLRFGLVIVSGLVFEIADIGMRMLVPRELFNAQGFPPSYIIDRDIDGCPITGTAATLMCGNSVSPVEAADLYASNYDPEADGQLEAA